MKTIKTILIAGVIALTTGCAGQQSFVKPAPDRLRLGVSSEAQIVAAVGKPTETSEAVVNGETVKFVAYRYRDGTDNRSVLYSLHNDKMVGEELDSNYDEDSTKFDTVAIRDVKVGMSKEQVLAIMGKPSGHIQWPRIADKAGEGFVYTHTSSTYLVMVTSFITYLVYVDFDANGKVSAIYKDGKSRTGTAK